VKRILARVVCVSVCPSLHSHTTAQMDVTWGNGRGDAL